MYFLILLLPILSSTITGFSSKYISRKGSCMVALFSMFIAMILSLLIFYEIVWSRTVCKISLWNWFKVDTLSIYWEFLFDSLTSIMLLVVLLVSFSVHIYSVEYMNYDAHISRFMSYLSLFTFFMLLLVTADNFLQLFVGWEGVGFCSYLLINFWFTRILANKAAMKALIINKIGDVSLLLGIILIFGIFNSLDFSLINCSIWGLNLYYILNLKITLIYINLDLCTLSILLIIIGVAAKSAQIGLHIWLPDAMEGPTPVSALIHAATMVTAGIFLLLRITYLLNYSQFCLIVIIFLGGITAFVSATIGLFQNDIKKIIAYSTCSQLGYMMFSCGLSNYSSSLFHLMNHAFFKALLFLSAGAIIHSMLDQQDIRRMGNLVKSLPISYLMMFVGSLALMGLPFLTGFYSKDFLIEWSFGSFFWLSLLIYWLSVISALLTTFYSIKLLYITFLIKNNSYLFILWNKNKFLLKENKLFINLPLILLLLGSVFVGYFFKELFIGIGTDIWINSLYTEKALNLYIYLYSEFLPIYIKLIPFIFSLISILLALLFFNFFLLIYKKLIYFIVKFVWIVKKKYLKIILSIQILSKVHTFLNQAYLFSENYNNFLYKNRNIGNIFFITLDKGIIDRLSSLSIVTTINNLTKYLSKKYSGLVDYYIFVMVLGIVYILSLFLLLLSISLNLKLFLVVVLVSFLEIIKEYK